MNKKDDELSNCEGATKGNREQEDLTGSSQVKIDNFHFFFFFFLMCYSLFLVLFFLSLRYVGGQLQEIFSGFEKKLHDMTSEIFTEAKLLKFRRISGRKPIFFGKYLWTLTLKEIFFNLA